MRVSREQAEKNREKVLETAARLFRQHGVDGIGIADLMKSAGFTHGGFYGQFESKEDLAAEATARALQENADNWSPLIDRKDDAWGAFKRAYLSLQHCQHPEAGCAFTTLAVEAPRRGARLRGELTRGLRSLLGRLESIVPRKRGTAPREQAMVALSAMVGAVVLARATDDEGFAKQVLKAVEQGI